MSSVNNNDDETEASESQTTIAGAEFTKSESLVGETKQENSRDPISSKEGFFHSTGSYKKVDNYNSLKDQYTKQNQMEKVKDIEKAWKENSRNEVLTNRSWPPQRIIGGIFWTAGHYSKDKWAKAREESGVARTESSPAPARKVISDTPSATESGEDDERGRRKSDGYLSVGAAAGGSVATLGTASVSESKQEIKARKKEEKAQLKAAKKEEKAQLKAAKKEAKKKKNVEDNETEPTEDWSVVTQELEGDFSTHRLHVSNLPLTIREKDVKKIFKGSAEITISPDPTQNQMIATVRYEDAKDAFKAFKTTKKSKFEGKPLVVSPKLRE